MQPAASPRLLFHALCALAALSIVACGGRPPAPGADDGGDDGGLTGVACQFDSDCQPPDFICAANGTCARGCLAAGCPLDKTCNPKTGRCDAKTDGGTSDGGTDGGTDGGDGGVGTPSDTLCKTCAINADCHAGGLCVSDSTHTTTFCTQDCTAAPCPADYNCTVDHTGTKHQCYPAAGVCPGSNPDGGSDGGTDGGTSDPGTPSTNPEGCGFCGGCAVNNDCNIDHVCINGVCAAPCTSPGFPSIDCIFQGAFLGTCTEDPIGNGLNYCTPVLGICIPIPGIGGDFNCVPSGTNPNCQAAPDVAPTMGPNVDVVTTHPMLATEDSITRNSAGQMAIGYIGVDSSGNSYMGVARSTDEGAHWSTPASGLKMKANTPVQSDPVLVTSKWNDGTARERMHYVWVGYTIDTSNPSQPIPKDMFMESSYSDDGGNNWSNGINVTTTSDNANGSLLLDKPWVAAGPDGTLILTYSVGDQSQQHMYASISTDHGASWQPKKRIENGANDHGYNLGMPVFDPRDTTGNTIYVTYVRYVAIEANAENTVQLAKSTDRGSTWSTPMVVSGDDMALFEPPSIAIDNAGHLYVGYVGTPAAAGQSGAKFWDARVAMIDVTGATPRVMRQARVNDDFPPGQTTGCFQHFHTMVATDPASGKVFASWLDNRRPNAKGGLYYAVSTDQGATWSANKRVSDQEFTFNPDHSNSQLNFLGDYFGFIFDGTKLFFAWSDPRNGQSSQVFFASGTP